MPVLLQRSSGSDPSKRREEQNRKHRTETKQKRHEKATGAREERAAGATEERERAEEELSGDSVKTPGPVFY